LSTASFPSSVLWGNPKGIGPYPALGVRIGVVVVVGVLRLRLYVHQHVCRGLVVVVRGLLRLLLLLCCSW
jgi:hypothetical protein